MKTLTLGIVFCLMTAAAFGQTNPKVKDLEGFAGTWKCTGTAFASPWGPEHPTKATVTGAWTLGGAWLEIHYTEAKTAKNPHPYEVRALWGYDEQPKAFFGGSFDNMGSYATGQSPGWEGDTLVFTGATHAGGMTVNSRDSFTRAGKNEMDHSTEMEGKDGWKKVDQEVCKR